MRKRSKPSAQNALHGQIALFTGPDTPLPFRKAVAAVHSKPKSPLTLIQRKLANAWLKNAIENEADADGFWELGIIQLSEVIGFDSNNRDHLRDSAERLMNIIFEWDVLAPEYKRVQWKASVLFPEIELRRDAIRYQISSQMREKLTNPEIYAVIDMTIVRRFRRVSALATWEHCVRFEKIGRTNEVQWELFRDMILGESSEKQTYQEYKYFKSKVLNPAIAEINAVSNHTVEMIESKHGKRVVGLQFLVRKKATPEEVVNDERLIELGADLAKLGVPQSETKKLAAHHPLDEIRNALEYTKRRMADRKQATLDNPAAYFRHTLVHRYASGPEVIPAAEERSNRKGVDIKEAFAAHLIGEAEQYFGELDVDDQTALVNRYNEQQSVTTLLVKSRMTKVARIAFLQWLAIDTWGEPTADDLLAFAQSQLNKASG